MPLASLAGPADAAQSAQRCFPETRYTLCEPFLSYWGRNGGVERFGYPISEPVAESAGNWYGTVQYFERRRMEHHPELAGTPHEVLLGLLGTTISDLQSLSVCPFSMHAPWRAAYSRVSFLGALGCPAPRFSASYLRTRGLRAAR